MMDFPAEPVTPNDQVSCFNWTLIEAGNIHAGKVRPGPWITPTVKAVSRSEISCRQKCSHTMLNG